MKKIVVLGAELNPDQKTRLERIGSANYLPSPKSSEELVKQTKGADILYSDGAFLLDSLNKLENIFVTYPYIELGVFNSKTLKERGVQVANAQGGNRPSIIEWVMFMTLALFRNFIPLVRPTKNPNVRLEESLAGKKVLIVGKGSIGSKIAEPLGVLGMEVSFYERGGDLLACLSDKDLVINALNSNSTSKNLLDEAFFSAMKRGAFFISFVRPHTYSLDGLLESINKDVVAGAAIDCDPEKFGDTSNVFYQKALANSKVLVTPHIAFSTKQAVANGAEIAVENIEAFIAGKPQNILAKE
jgi:D-2-hydroxyacid dehydrogenase (NADP+)